MLRRLSLGVLAVLLAVPMSVQAQSGWQVRVDRSTNANDPDDVPNVEFAATEDGLRLATGPAAVAWHAEHSVSGAYTLKGTFHLEAPSDHANYYGLVFGGGELDNPSQNYLYFLIAQNGSFIVKHRANDEAVHDIVGRTRHEAINTPGDDGMSTNELEVRVSMDELVFLVNGTVVHTQPHEGMASRTDGIYGVRVNHRIPGVRVAGLGVSQMQ